MRGSVSLAHNVFAQEVEICHRRLNVAPNNVYRVSNDDLHGADDEVGQEPKLQNGAHFMTTRASSHCRLTFKSPI